MNTKQIFWKLLRCKLGVFALIGIIVLLIINFLFDSSSSFIILVNTIIMTYGVGFIVNIHYQMILKEELSKDHFKIIKHKDEFNKSGITQYYGSFKDSIEDIRNSIRQSKNVSIYVIHGSTVLNTLNHEIKTFLINKNNLRLYIMSEENKMIPALSELWGYQLDRISKKILDSKEIINNIKDEIKKEYKLDVNIEIIDLVKYPVNYSLYICDDEIYYIPSKHHESKTFIPMVIRAQKTINKDAIYNKLFDELEHIYKESK